MFLRILPVFNVRSRERRHFSLARPCRCPPGLCPTSFSVWRLRFATVSQRLLRATLGLSAALRPNQTSSLPAQRTQQTSPRPRAKSWSTLFVTFYVAALSPAFAEGSITVGEDKYEFGDFESQQDGTSTADIYSSPEGESGTLVRNPEDGTHLISLSGGKKILITGSGCTDNPDIVKDYKEVTVRECRRDKEGKLAWYKVNYLEYTCTKPPYYTRRIPQSVVAEEPEAPCTEEDYQASGRNAAIYGTKWVGVKPPTETPPPGEKTGGGGVIDTPPGVTKYPCLTDEAKADLRRAQQNLALEIVRLTEALQQLHPVNLRLSAAEANYKTVKAKVDAAANAGDVKATNDANWQLWHAGNRLQEAKKALAGLIEVIKLHERFVEYYKKQVDYYSTLPPCPEVKEVEGGGGGGVPREKPGSKPLRRWTPLFPESWKISTGTDGETWCTYGDGNGAETSIALTDESGVSVLELLETLDTELEQVATLLESMPATPPETPPPPEETTEPTPETPTVAETAPEQPLNTPETPPTTENLPEEPTTPETPPTTEKVPEEPTSPIPDTIFVKAKESVLEGQPPGAPIESQVVKLFPAEEPNLPGTAETTEAEDTGFDKDPVQCTTGTDGDCKMQIPAEDRAAYDLPDTGALPANYRVDYDLPKDSGGVAETTGKPKEPDVKSGTPAGANVAYEVFSIGERTFTRLVYKQAYGLDHDFDEQFKPVFGESYEEDYCRDKQPGPPLGMQPTTFGALNHDLPEATIKFGAATPARGDAP
jgi:hypothetical protein